jgi:hypothetical protein
MPETSRRNKREWVKAELESLAKLEESRAAPTALQAVQSLLTSLDYPDAVLVRSHVNTFLDASRDFVSDILQSFLGRPKLIREAWKRIWEESLKGRPFENLDDVGREFESVVNKALIDLIDLRDGPLRTLHAHGYDIVNAAQLESDIADLRKLKADVLEDWPWSDRSLPPVDRQMVQESRAAIARGEGERIEDLIRRLGGEPTKNN